jgi:lipid-binding SYLF domain-containing protein
MKATAYSVVAAVLCLGLGSGVSAQQSTDTTDEVEQSEKAARVFDEIMGAPDKAIPEAILDDARCVAVFPSVVKVAFGFGGSGGRGLASCRTATGWSAPAYFTLGGGSVGFQIGAESTDLVMLFMTDDGLTSLIANTLELGADASVSAGPVGRQAGASTDVALNAQILSYSRSKGLFAGVALKGAVIRLSESDMRDVYGSGVLARDVLNGSKLGPPAVLVFPSSLARHSARAGS